MLWASPAAEPAKKWEYSESGLAVRRCILPYTPNTIALTTATPAIGLDIPRYNPWTPSRTTIFRKQSYVPRYSGLRWFCVCRCTFTVSNGKPTRTPAQPVKRRTESVRLSRAQVIGQSARLINSAIVLMVLQSLTRRKKSITRLEDNQRIRSIEKSDLPCRGYSHV